MTKGIFEQGEAARTTQGTTAILAAATGVRHVVKKIIITGKISTTAVVSITDGTLTPIKYTPDYGHPGEIDFGDGYKFTKGAAVNLVLGTADIQVNAVAIGIKMGA